MKAEPALLKLLQTDKHIRLVYKDWPIFGDVSVYAAKIALAANFQGKYAAVHDAMMATKRKKATQAEVREIALAAGADGKQLDTDLAAHSAEIDAILKRTDKQATAMGFAGTPVFLIGPFLVAAAARPAGFPRGGQQRPRTAKTLIGDKACALSERPLMAAGSASARACAAAPRARARGRETLIRRLVIAAAARRIDEIMQPPRDAGIENIAALLKRLEAVGVENLRPQIAVIAGRIAVARKDMLEMRRAVAHRNRVRHADARQLLSLESDDVEVLRRRIEMEAEIDQRRGGIFDRGEALVELARGEQPLRAAPRASARRSR